MSFYLNGSDCFLNCLCRFVSWRQRDCLASGQRMLDQTGWPCSTDKLVRAQWTSQTDRTKRFGLSRVFWTARLNVSWISKIVFGRLRISNSESRKNEAFTFFLITMASCNSRWISLLHLSASCSWLVHSCSSLSSRLFSYSCRRKKRRRN